MSKKKRSKFEALFDAPSPMQGLGNHDRVVAGRQARARRPLGLPGSMIRRARMKAAERATGHKPRRTS